MSFDKIQNCSDLLFFSSDEYLHSMSKAGKIHRIFYKINRLRDETQNIVQVIKVLLFGACVVLPNW